MWLMMMACSGEAPVQDEEPAAEPTPAQEKVAFDDVMKEHYALATDARTAVIMGDLAQGQASGAALRDMSSPDVPEVWEPYIGTRKQAAGKVADASDLAAAGQAVAELSVVCGSCHTTTGGGPKADIKAAKETSPPEDSHMRAHLWCADQMWLGLVGPDKEMFAHGAKVLAQSHLHPAVEDEAIETPEGFEALERQIHELAGVISTAETDEDKVKLYGQFISTCSQCHNMFQVRPPNLGN